MGRAEAETSALREGVRVLFVPFIDTNIVSND